MLSKMKTYFYWVIALLVAMAFTSCKESDDIWYDKISLENVRNTKNVNEPFRLEVGQSVSIGISQGSGKFEITTQCNRISAYMEGGKVNIRALEEGESCCFVYDVLTREEVSIRVFITPSTRWNQ